MNTPLQTRPAHRRLLAPLATLLVAIAIVGTSGATFTSSSATQTNVYTTGTLEQTNDKTGDVIFNAQNMKPGDVVIGSAMVTNSGSLPATFTLHEDGFASSFSDPSLLQLVVVDTATGATVYSGAMGALAAQPISVDWLAGEARTFDFTVTLAPETPNVDQGATASAIYRWEAVQTAPTVYDQR